MSNIDGSYIERILNDIQNLERDVFNKMNSAPTKQDELFKRSQLYTKESKLLHSIKTNLLQLKLLLPKIEEAEKRK